jgi:hypothetical protein
MVDATVLFAGIGWPRWSYEVLRHVLRGDVECVLSPLVIRQARRNLVNKLPEFVESFDRLLDLGSFEMVADPSDDEVVNNLDLVRQEEDVPVALAAISAKIDYFISEDKDFTEESATTLEIHKHLKIMRPVIFLREVMGWSKEDLEIVRRREWAWERKKCGEIFRRIFVIPKIIVYPKPLRPPPPPPPPLLDELLLEELELELKLELLLQLLLLLLERELPPLGRKLGLLATKDVAVVFNMEKKFALTLLREVNAPVAASFNEGALGVPDVAGVVPDDELELRTPPVNGREGVAVDSLERCDAELDLDVPGEYE